MESKVSLKIEFILCIMNFISIISESVVQRPDNLVLGPIGPDL